MTRPKTVVTWFLASTLFALPAAAHVGPPPHPDHWWCPARIQGVPLPGKFCSPGWHWESQTYIPVFVHPELHEHMVHPDEQPWTAEELLQEVRFCMERLNDQSGANLPPLVVVGFEPWGTAWDAPAFTPRSIAIRPNRGQYQDWVGGTFPPQFELKPDCTSYQNGCQDHDNGVRVFLASSQQCLNPRRTYDHMNFAPPDLNANQTFCGLLNHEMMHALALDHWQDCHSETPFTDEFPDIGCGSPAGYCCGAQGDYCGVSYAVNEISFDDSYGLRTLYGPTRGSTDYQLRVESTNGLDWVDYTGPPFDPMPFSGHYLGGGESDGFVFVPFVMQDVDLSPHAWIWQAGFDFFIDLGQAELEAQLGPTKGTFGGGFWTSFYMSGQRGAFTAMAPRHRRQDAPTFGDGVTATLDDFDKSVCEAGNVFCTQRNGHTGAYDPRSQRLVHVWRQDSNGIRLAVSDLDGGPYQSAVRVLAPERAAYTPSVSCGPSAIPYNCMMIWAHLPNGVDEHFYTTRYTQFRVEGGPTDFSFVWAPRIWELYYVQVGPPSVAYKGPIDAPDAFVVAWKAPGSCFFTNFKRSGAELGVDQIALATERTHCPREFSCDPTTPSIRECVQIGPPAAAADSSNHIGQAWVVGNDYFR